MTSDANSFTVPGKQESVTYEVDGEFLKETVANRQRQMALSAVREVNLQNRGHAGYRCFVQDRDGKEMVIACTSILRPEFAQFMKTFHRQLKPHADHVGFTRGNPTRFALAAAASVFFACLGTVCFVVLWNWGFLGSGGGWSLGAVVLMTVYTASQFIWWARRNASGRYDPYEGMLPFGMERHLP